MFRYLASRWYNTAKKIINTLRFNLEDASQITIGAFAFLVVALILFAINRLPILDDTILAIKRVIIISMPASMGAIIVDGFDKEF